MHRYLPLQLDGETIENYHGRAVVSMLGRLSCEWDCLDYAQRFYALRDFENELWYVVREMSWELQAREDEALDQHPTTDGLVTRKEFTQAEWCLVDRLDGKKWVG